LELYREQPSAQRLSMINGQLSNLVGCSREVGCEPAILLAPAGPSKKASIVAR
jgi:hypothetical protein